MKRAYAFLTCLAMVCMLLLCSCGGGTTTTTRPQDGTTGLNYRLSRDGESYIVTGMGNMTDKYISIPSMHDGLPVSAIAQNAFSGKTHLRAVALPDTILEIGAYAFENCYNLRAIDLGQGLQTISSGAFSGCMGLTTISLPAGLTMIEDRAFVGCMKLYEVVNHSELELTIGTGEHGAVAGYAMAVKDAEGNAEYLDGIEFRYIDTQDGLRFAKRGDSYSIVTYMGESSFLTLPDDIDGANTYTIGQYAFNMCDTLETVTISSAVTEIGRSGFKGCTSLDSISIPDSVQLIDEEAFMGCKKMTSVRLPAGIVTIPRWCFAMCRGLTECVIPDSVRVLENGAFESCPLVLTIPSGVEAIGSGVKLGQIGTNIIFEEMQGWYMTDDHNCWSDRTGGTLTDLSTVDPMTFMRNYWYRVTE